MHMMDIMEDMDVMVASPVHPPLGNAKVLFRNICCIDMTLFSYFLSKVQGKGAYRATKLKNLFAMEITYQVEDFSLTAFGKKNISENKVT